MGMRQRGVGTTGDNRIKRGLAESGVVKPRVDRERDVALGPAGPNLVEDAARHRGQPSGGFAQRGDLVLVLREPRALDDPRSEERRVGKECRSRWVADHTKRKRTTSE